MTGVRPELSEGVGPSWGWDKMIAGGQECEVPRRDKSVTPVVTYLSPHGFLLCSFPSRTWALFSEWKPDLFRQPCARHYVRNHGATLDTGTPEPSGVVTCHVFMQLLEGTRFGLEPAGLCLSPLLPQHPPARDQRLLGAAGLCTNRERTVENASKIPTLTISSPA